MNNSICVQLRRNVLGKCAKNSSVAAKQNEVGVSQAYEVSSYDIILRTNLVFVAKKFAHILHFSSFIIYSIYINLRNKLEVIKKINWIDHESAQNVAWTFL